MSHTNAYVTFATTLNSLANTQTDSITSDPLEMKTQYSRPISTIEWNKVVQICKAVLPDAKRCNVLITALSTYLQELDSTTTEALADISSIENTLHLTNINNPAEANVAGMLVYKILENKPVLECVESATFITYIKALINEASSNNTGLMSSQDKQKFDEVCQMLDSTYAGISEVVNRMTTFLGTLNANTRLVDLLDLKVDASVYQANLTRLNDDIASLRTTLNTFLDVNDTTVDQLSELVALLRSTVNLQTFSNALVNKADLIDGKIPLSQIPVIDLTGDRGPRGYCYRPYMVGTVLHFDNDGNLPNPEPVNLKGDTGPQGPKGDPGAKGDKGDTGDRGSDGIITPIPGFFGLTVDENGDLYVITDESDAAPSIVYDSTDGNLYYVITE